MSEPTILIDIDDTLVDTRPFLLQLLAATGISPNCSTYDLFEGDCEEATKRTYAAVCEEVRKRPGAVYHLPPKEGAEELLEKLRSLGRVVAVTAPMVKTQWATERLEALVDKFGFELEDVHLCHGKHRVEGDFLVEDSPRQIQKWFRGAGRKGTAIALRYDWTVLELRNIILPPRASLLVVDSIYEIHNVVKEELLYV